MEVSIAELSADEIRQAVAANLGDKNFQLIGFEIRKASENALGFLGDHFRITVNVLVDGAEKTLQYFAKSVPCKNLAHHEYTIKTGAFYKEIELYKTLFRDMAESITAQHQKWLPEFYYARASELLILEDLALDGFYMYPERTVLDLAHSEKAVEIMAVMHAASFIFEEKLKLGKVKTRSKKFQNGVGGIGELYPNLIFETEASDVKGHPGNMFWEAGFRSQGAVTDVLPDYTEEQRKVIKEKIGDKLRLALQFVKPSTKFRNVLLHGDLWTNNLLFRKDSHGHVSDAIIIDFQLGRYGPPAHDLLMFFYLTNTRQFRDQYMQQLLHLYYSTLTKELKAEDLDISSILPKEEFLESVEHYREYAILNNVVYFQTICTPANLCDYLASSELFHKNQYEDRSELIVASFKQDDIYRSRMTESVRELAEFYHWV